jgi:hypothetical protein
MPYEPLGPEWIAPFLSIPYQMAICRSIPDDGKRYSCMRENGKIEWVMEHEATEAEIQAITWCRRPKPEVG